MGRFTHRFSGYVLGLGLFLAGTGVAVADIGSLRARTGIDIAFSVLIPKIDPIAPVNHGAVRRWPEEHGGIDFAEWQQR